MIEHYSSSLQCRRGRHVGGGGGGCNGGGVGGECGRGGVGGGR